MITDRTLRAAAGVLLALIVDVALAQAVNTGLLSHMAVPDADRLAQAVLVLATGAAVAGAACQLLAGHRSLAPYAVVAAILGAGMFWLKGFEAQMQVFAFVFIFAAASATLFAAFAADRLRARL